MRGIHVALVALFATFGANAFDSDHPDHPLVVSDNLTLSDVVREATVRAGTPELLTAKLAEADAMAREASLALNAPPSLSVRYNGDAPGEDRGLHEIETRLMMALKWPGLRAAQHRVADVAATLATSDSAAGRWRIAGAAREVLWEYRTALDERDAARIALTLAEDVARNVAARYTAGDLARSDSLLADSERLARARDLAAARVRLLDIERRYTALTGLDEVPASIDETEPTDAGIEQHPLLLAADMHLTRARENVAVQRYTGRTAPQLAIGPRWERGASSDPFADSLGFELNLPFGSGPHSALDTATAEREVTEALIARRNMSRELELALHEAEHDLLATRARRENIDAWVALATERETIAERAFAAGETSLTEFLRIRLEAGAARRAAVVAKDQVGQAIARYNQAIGLIPGGDTETPSR